MSSISITLLIILSIISFNQPLSINVSIAECFASRGANRATHTYFGMEGILWAQDFDEGGIGLERDEYHFFFGGGGGSPHPSILGSPGCKLPVMVGRDGKILTSLLRSCN